jgi:zinc D-Ala-D-Ala carboxypeptidase
MMRWPQAGWRLLNGNGIEALPAASLQARANHHARQLAGACWVLRRKRDGRYLATLDSRGRLQPMHPQARRHDRDLAELLLRLDADVHPECLPTDRTRAMLQVLGVPDDYGRIHALALVAEPGELAFAGFDRYHRPLWLEASAAAAWRRMRHAAAGDDIRLQAISGYRSHDYQLGIFRRKLARGQSVEQILAVNAAPGYSEHHSGQALDLSSPGEAAAEESFEHTPAFAWLQSNASRFGFVLSYPRDNPHGIVYEPWHWCHRPDAG